MKNKRVVAKVVVTHCLAAGIVVMVQGCGTLGGGSGETGGDATAPIMPPPYETQQISTKRPVGQSQTYVSTPVAVSPTVAAQPPIVQTTEYVVQKGDSLSVIALRYRVSVGDIVDLNALPNKNVIRVGQRLLLPGNVNLNNPRTVRPRSSSTSPAARAQRGLQKYVVRKGDSLSVIAYKNSTSVKALQEVNGISGTRILPGQSLYLPQGSVPRAVTTTTTRTESAPPAPPAGGTETTMISTEVVTPPVAPPVAPPTTRSDEYIEHVVSAGEDIYTVAMHYTVLPEDVKRLNGLEENTLRPGQVLKIRVPRSGN